MIDQWCHPHRTCKLFKLSLQTFLLEQSTYPFVVCRFLKPCRHLITGNLLMNIKVKFTSVTVDTPHADVSPHQLHQLPGDGKTQPGALFGMIFPAVYLLERAKQLSDILFPDSLAGILD